MSILDDSLSHLETGSNHHSSRQKKYGLKGKSPFLFGAFALVAIFGVFFSVRLAQNAQDIRNQAAVDQGQVLLSAVTSPSTLRVGQPATVTFRVNTQGVQVDGVQVAFAINTSQSQPLTAQPTISVVSASGMSFLGNPVIQNQNGTYSIAFTVAPQIPNSFSSTSPVDIATVTFTPTSVGTVSFVFNNTYSKATIKDSPTGEDTLLTVQPMNFVVQAEGPASPTPSATPTPIGDPQNTPSATLTPTPTPIPQNLLDQISLSIPTNTLPNGQVGQVYSATVVGVITYPIVLDPVVGSNGMGVNNQLPPGLSFGNCAFNEVDVGSLRTLTITCLLSGTPTTTGTFTPEFSLSLGNLTILPPFYKTIPITILAPTATLTVTTTQPLPTATSVVAPTATTTVAAGTCNSIMLRYASNGLQVTAPLRGDVIRFHCGDIPGTFRYEFRLREPGSNNFSPLQASNQGSNQSVPYTITQGGDFSAQCRLCSGVGAETCQDWE